MNEQNETVTVAVTRTLDIIQQQLDLLEKLWTPTLTPDYSITFKGEEISVNKP